MIKKAESLRDDQATAQDLLGRMLEAIGEALKEFGGTSGQGPGPAADLLSAAEHCAALVLRAKQGEPAHEVLGKVTGKHVTAADLADGAPGSPLEHIGNALKLLPPALPVIASGGSMDGIGPILEGVLDQLVGTRTVLA